MTILTYNTGLRRAQATQLVAPAAPWKPPVTQRVDPDLPQFRPVKVVMGSRSAEPDPIHRPILLEASTGAKQVTLVKSFGKGPLQVSNLRLGTEVLVGDRLLAGKETLVRSDVFGEVSYELLEGRPGDGGLSMYASVLKKENFDEKLVFSDESGNQNFSSRETEPQTTRVDIEVVFPTGISEKTKVSGETKWIPKRATVQIRIRKTPTGSNNDSLQKDVTVQGVDNDSELTARFPYLPCKAGAGTYKVYVRVSHTWNGKNPQARWKALTSRGQKTLGGLQGHCVVAVSGDLQSLGGDQFLKSLNADCVPELKETIGGTAVATRNPAAAFLDVLQGRGAMHPLADSRIDAAAISAWASECATAGYSFDMVFGADGGRGTVGDALRLICAAGRARHVVRDGLHSVIREPTGDALQLFCPANMQPQPGFKVIRNAYGEALHGLRCTFENREQSFRRETFIVYASGFSASNATEIEDWSFDGVTNKAQVVSLAAYHLEVLATRGKQYEFAVGKDHLRVMRGDLVRVAHYRIRKGTSWGRVTAVPSLTDLEVSRPCSMATGGTYALRVRQADGDQVLATVQTIPGEHLVLRTTTNHGAAVGDLFVFGESGAESELCVVLKVAHAPDLTAALVVTPAGAAAAATGSGGASPGSGGDQLTLPVCGYVTTKGGITLHEIA